jgi:hypothetical protein
MEYCDTTLTKYIQASDGNAVNWAECVRYLMDGAAGLFERMKGSERESDSEKDIHRQIDRQGARETEGLRDRQADR